MTPEEEALAAKLIAEYQDYHLTERQRVVEKGIYTLRRGMRDVLGVDLELTDDSVVYMGCKFVPNGPDEIAIEYTCAACGALHLWPVYSSMNVGEFLIPERRAEIVGDCPMPKD